VIVVSDAIRQAREALGLQLPVLAEAAGLDPAVLHAYESGEQKVPGYLLWRLSEILGVPLADIDSPGSLQRHLEVMAVRFRADQRAVSDRVRLAVARAASAARDYVELEALIERRPRYGALTQEFAPVPIRVRREVWKAGRALAIQLRERLGLHDVVASMIDLIEKRLDVMVIWQKLPREFAGYAFCDEIHGPAIVLNVIDRNQNELVRRFTLAHELCHVLFDRDDLSALSRFDEYEDFFEYADEQREPRESRANAFAIHLLAPEHLFTREWDGNRRNIRELMTRFGISFEAVQHHLANYRLHALEGRISGVDTSPTDKWRMAESPELWYPAFDEIPIERRHALAKLAFELWINHEITTSRLCEVLRVGLPHEQLMELARLYLDTIPA
jgi:Zn-dependent peptidase ImmA (M78 family)